MQKLQHRSPQCWWPRPITCSSLPFHINLEHYHHRHDYNNGWTLTGSLLPYHIHFRAGLSTQERIQYPLSFNYLERFHQSPTLDFYSVVGATTTKSSTKSLASVTHWKSKITVNRIQRIVTVDLPLHCQLLQPTCSWKMTSRYMSVGEPDYLYTAQCAVCVVWVPFNRTSWDIS